MTPNQRLEKQKQRVLRKTMDRLMVRRSKLDNEKLEYAYRDGVDVALANKTIRDDFSEIIDRYQVPRGASLNLFSLCF